MNNELSLFCQSLGKMSADIIIKGPFRLTLKTHNQIYQYTNEAMMA